MKRKIVLLGLFAMCGMAVCTGVYSYRFADKNKQLFNGNVETLTDDEVKLGDRIVTENGYWVYTISGWIYIETKSN
ncbi:MAG: hypothetical protein SNG38_08910 [Rikenellaceae bacterium]